jgi:hypothetical protein
MVGNILDFRLGGKPVANAAVAVEAGPSKIIKALHEDCSKVVTASCDAKYTQLNAASYGLANDLDIWIKVLANRPELPLFETASSEFVLALLNNSQGQYRNAFKGLRLVLELVLQGAYLSVNLVILSEWLKSQADTLWQVILDQEKGVFAVRYSRAFFPALTDEVGAVRTLAETLYREMSECTHGNVPNKIPLPKKIAFDEQTFTLWHEKVRTLRLIINFTLVVRYLTGLGNEARATAQPMIMDQMGHFEPVRQMFEGVA